VDETSAGAAGEDGDGELDRDPLDDLAGEDEF